MREYTHGTLPIVKRQTWRELLHNHAPVQLPAAHDALTARLIQRAGFTAYQIGGFALAGARHGVPDIDLVRFAEQAAGARVILAASDLPVLVDADDGYVDAKMSYTRCGHLRGKQVVPGSWSKRSRRLWPRGAVAACSWLLAPTPASPRDSMLP